MKSSACRLASLATAIVLVGASLAPFHRAEAENPGAEFDPGKVLQTPPPEVVETLAFDMNRIVAGQMRMIRYEASAYQRKVAEQRARAFVAAHRQAAAKAKTTAKPAPSSPKKTAKSKAAEPQTAKKTKEAPEPPKVAKSLAIPTPKPLPRYIAVDTVKDKRAAPNAKKVVMIWDTQSESLVGNNIYDVKAPPAVGANAKFETFSAQYIGAGL
jgi:hypothetical protein